MRQLGGQALAHLDAASGQGDAAVLIDVHEGRALVEKDLGKGHAMADGHDRHAFLDQPVLSVEGGYGRPGGADVELLLRGVPAEMGMFLFDTLTIGKTPAVGQQIALLQLLAGHPDGLGRVMQRTLDHPHALCRAEATKGGVGYDIGPTAGRAHAYVRNRVAIAAGEQRAFEHGRRQFGVGARILIMARLEGQDVSRG